MDIKKALQIVLDLAAENVLLEPDDDVQLAEQTRQIEAIKIVEDMAINQFGDD